MAVAVDRTPDMILDEDYRIVELGPGASSLSGPLTGRELWKAFPGSRPLFQPYYDRARQTGQPVEFVQFYNGRLARIRAVPKGAHLHLYWTELDRLDTLTLDRLRTSLAQASATIAEEETRWRRRGLRIVGGGEE